MPAPLADFLAAQAWIAFIVFARVGAAFAVLPGFAEAAVPARVRLLVAVAVTVVIAPSVAPGLPALPVEPAGLVLATGVEIVTGIFLGLVARMVLSAAQIAGTIIGYQTSLASAFAFDPGTQQQGVITAAWMSILALTVMFAADMHHLLLRAVADSYVVFPAGSPIDPGEFAAAATTMVARSFSLGMRMAMPFFVYAILLFVGFGLVQRLMPQMQVFFVAMPLQLMLGLILLAMGTFLAMTAFLDELGASLAGLLRQG
jgi:flagellar biosynthetic protein FliR